MSTPSIVDGQGRLIPQAGDRVYSPIDRGYFCLTQPHLELDSRIASALSTLGLDHDSSSDIAGQYVQELNACRESLLGDPQLRGLFEGVHVPFVLPPATEDFGQEFDQVLLPAVERSFLRAHPGREFRNFCSNGLAGNSSIVKSSRWGRIPAARVDSYVTGWYFPTALSGYAIPDQRTIVARLPESLVLSGPSEVAAAMICSPELLYKSDGKYGKLLALSSVEPTNPEEDFFFWFFESYGWDLEFNMRSYLGAVSEYYSGGLTVLASD
jgi:hypothetical protein